MEGIQNRPPMMGTVHINTNHSEHDKYSMVLGCFIGVLVLLVIIILLLAVSAHRQGSMLNNSNTAMSQISNLKKAIVSSKAVQKILPNFQTNHPNARQSKQHFENYSVTGTMGPMVNPSTYGGNTTAAFALRNQGSDTIGLGLQGIGIGSCGNNGSCPSTDTYMVNSSSTGGAGVPAPTNPYASSDAQMGLDFFKEIGTIASDVNLGGGGGNRGGRRSN